jgi:hypothetical protein
VTGVASLILLPDIGDQRLRALHFDFERGDQRIFGVNDDVSGFALNFKADRKLHLCLPLSMLKNIGTKPVAKTHRQCQSDGPLVEGREPFRLISISMSLLLASVGDVCAARPRSVVKAAIPATAAAIAARREHIPLICRRASSR